MVQIHAPPLMMFNRFWSFLAFLVPCPSLILGMATAQMAQYRLSALKVELAPQEPFFCSTGDRQHGEYPP